MPLRPMKCCIAMLVGLVAAIGGCAVEDPLDTPFVDDLQQAGVVCADGPTVFGVDVSHHQGTIDWNAVAGDNVGFAFIRVSDGDPNNGGTADRDFADNWPNAKSAGVMRGVYQYFRPNHDAVAQADYLIDHIGGAMTVGDLPPVIDVEATGGQSSAQIVAGVHAWIDRVESRLGVTPIIYTGKYFWQDNVASTDFADYLLWAPHYTSNACPNIADQWSDWGFWQYTDSGNVEGIGGVDSNYFNGSVADLEALTFGDPVCGDGSCNGGETHDSCPADCPVCESIPANGRIIDDLDICFEPVGMPQWFREETGGHDGHLYWTYALESSADAVGVWTLTFDEAGDYLVEAYTDTAHAQSTQARYQVLHDGTTTTSVVDQTAATGWAEVGEFTFAAGGSQDVRLEDLTGEPYADRVQLAFDALRFTRIDQPMTPDAGPGDPDAAPGAPDADPGAPDADPSSPDATPTGPDAGPTLGADAGDGDSGIDGGCGCRSASGSNAGASVLLVMLAVLLGRRRRRSRIRA